jgi:hypothetical protein
MPEVDQPGTNWTTIPKATSEIPMQSIMSRKISRIFIFLGRRSIFLLISPHRRLMQEATQAAPKPLSMLTTVTLEAHELSIPRSAAIPPKLAP